MIQRNTIRPVIFFDGDCNLCNGFVRFVMRKDTRKLFRFTSLQSEKAQEILAQVEFGTDNMDAVILQEGRKIATESDAVLLIAKMLPGAWSMLYLLRIIPRSVRDALYRFIARHRYQVFGRCESCTIPELRQSR